MSVFGKALILSLRPLSLCVCSGSPDVAVQGIFGISNQTQARIEKDGYAIFFWLAPVWPLSVYVPVCQSEVVVDFAIIKCIWPDLSI